MKKQQRALEKWAKLFNGIRIRQRVQAEYGQGGSSSISVPVRQLDQHETVLAADVAFSCIGCWVIFPKETHQAHWRRQA